MSTTAEYKINFDEIKQTVSMEQIVTMLALQLKRTKPTQWKGTCPFCTKTGGFVINADGGRDKTGAFNCFKCSAGGDQLELVSLSRGNPRKDRQGALAAAKELHRAFMGGDRSSDRSPKSDPPHPPRRAFNVEEYAKALDPAAQELVDLAVAPETLREWKAGFAKGGVNAKRLALPMTKPDGTIDGYMGMALSDEEPRLKFPTGIDPHHYLFGSDRVEEGELTIVNNPIQVLQAYENGMTNTVAFLSESLVVEQLEVLIALCHAKGITSVSIF